MLGMGVERKTLLPRIHVTWPHKISIGASCRIEHDVYFHFDGIYTEDRGIVIGDNCFIGSGTEFNIRKRIEIGSDCLIASGCRFIDHDHGIHASARIRLQSQPTASIEIGSDVWIGANVIVLKGVSIGNGAVIGAGAVVTRSIPAYSIARGVPARVVGMRS